mmetsp:Transcript_26080/g.32164  ORF Transcript_26080/g.32164 Transcript_26080/m.32164 type:complete len:277 (+) Transcript_26080:306-1136(+)
MKAFTFKASICAFILTAASAFAPVKPLTQTTNSRHLHLNLKPFFEDEPKILQQFDFPNYDQNNSVMNVITSIAAATTLALMPFPAEAASTAQIPSALAAYGHYLSLLLIVGCVTYERFTVEAGMSKEKETNLAIADISLGVAGVALLASGYYRTTAYGKGWDFYSHEPIFWLKMVFVCIFGAATLFPTTTIIKRSIAIRNEKFEPMSEKLAKRLTSVLTAEIVMLASIPLAATLMSRGVGYTEAIPFNIIGPVLCALTAGGLGFKYVKEALTWSED